MKYISIITADSRQNTHLTADFLSPSVPLIEKVRSDSMQGKMIEKEGG